jgi:acylaminoacyl-peptidase
MSPVHRIDAIQTPLLILMGLKDQRVPPSQSKLLYHGLLTKKKKVKMLAFENDQHALDSVEADLLSFEASLRWYEADLHTTVSLTSFKK